ncbi:MAG: hypothetical protein PUF61_06760, partial [Spirochaetales bacterium]|nr:hypothetical protein [Spirochaetales bacterium]
RFGCLVDSILRGAFADLFTTPDLSPVPSAPLRFVAPFIAERRRITPVGVDHCLRVGAPLTLFRPPIKGLPGLVTGRIGGLMHAGFTSTPQR